MRFCPPPDLLQAYLYHSHSADHKRAIVGLFFPRQVHVHVQVLVLLLLLLPLLLVVVAVLPPIPANTSTQTIARTYARMHARTHARTHARMHARTHARLQGPDNSTTLCFPLQGIFFRVEAGACSTLLSTGARARAMCAMAWVRGVTHIYVSCYIYFKKLKQ